MKVGIIRCMQTEDYCPGTADFMAIRNKRGSFADLDDEFGTHWLYELWRLPRQARTAQGQVAH